ncbi:SH3 domain-containing protein [Kitasatospora sp. NPDC050463]|uniref:SH3 domain-containing protein n=1 Tax=Kitasatospora sp. NPDC050463 TaxID=3155786 RepID=UPI0033F23252
MRLIGRAASAVLSLTILILPAVAAGGDHQSGAGPGPRPPENGHAGWEVAAGAANVRRDHSVNDTVLGLTHCGDRVEIVDTWTSPLGTRWGKVVVTRTGLTGWVLWSLLTRHEPTVTSVANCPPRECRRASPPCVTGGSVEIGPVRI